MIVRGSVPDSAWVSVVIPARDAAPTVARMLDALRRQEFDRPFEVIVVDDGSRDETPAIVARYAPFAKLIRRDRSEGPGSARNVGVRAAIGGVLAFTDADCFPAPQWLARGLEAIAHGELVQGRVQPDPSVERTPFDRTVAVDRDGGFYETANLFVRREVFDAVGGFRDWALEHAGRRRFSEDRRRSRASRTPIGEDTLFAWSARRLGARSQFAPEALVHHAVIPGGVRDAMADRWHWTKDMPGLARLVPELRESTFYLRWFFDDWTAKSDLAIAGMLGGALTRRRLWLTAVIPYLDRLRREAMVYRVGRVTRPARISRAALYVLGAPAVDAATFVGLVVGSIGWRCLVL